MEFSVDNPFASSHPVSHEKRADDLLEETAEAYGLELPKDRGRYARVKEASVEYARSVHRMETSPLVRIDEGQRNRSDKVRRYWHDILCVLLLGTHHVDTSYEDVKRVGKFAVTVGGYPEYVSTFDEYRR